MNINDPSTWHNLAMHPEFFGGPFDPSWYDGDLDHDLKMLRSLAMALISNTTLTCRLCVLDDCTFFAEFFHAGDLIAKVWPALTIEHEFCYYIQLRDLLDEILIQTTSEAVEYILRSIQTGNNRIRPE